MDTQILIGLLLTILPIFELRGGLPVIVEYCVRNQISVWPYFLIVLILNILLIFFVFLFLDFLHELLMKNRIYRAVVGRFLNKVHHKSEKIKLKMNDWGYLALMFFVAIPLPGTGAWTGAAVAWMMELDRFRSFVAIALGILIAGLLILFLSFGLFSGLH